MAHTSGHAYFSLKDRAASIRAVMFKGFRQYLDFVPANGSKVIAIGDVSLYPRDGNYQLYVTRMLAEGVGEQFIAFENLKNKLAKEGLFEEAVKRPIPEYPQAVGVITSQTGAVLHDIQTVIARRYPVAEVVLYPAQVQGTGAAKTVVEAILRANAEGICDTLIIARGGGSMEDLWQFNDEALARAIRASHIPVISAVGHETDFSIADFAADLRAPTPSAAAELCVPDKEEIRMQLDALSSSMRRCLRARLDGAVARMAAAANVIGQSAKSAVFAHALRLNCLAAQMRDGINKAMTARKILLIETAKRLETASPSAALERGYGVVVKDGSAIRAARKLKAGDEIAIRWKDGAAEARVTKVREFQ